MKVLVTGAAGFLGSHLTAALLSRGDEVVALDHRLQGKCLTVDELARVRGIEADILDLPAVTRAAEGCATIFHCAAIVGVDAYSSKPSRTMETEEVGLRNVCRAALSNGGAKVIYASSSAVYGNTTGSVLLREEDEARPASSYGTAKYFNEFFLAAQFLETGLHSTALRIFNVYGPRQDDRLVIPRFIKSALAGEPIVIFGDGKQTRDFVYIDDVVAAALACADRAEGAEILNVSSGHETSIAALAQTIIALTESESVFVTREPPAGRSAFEVARCIGSREKLERITGAGVATPLEQGLRQTISAWIAKHAGARKAESGVVQ